MRENDIIEQTRKGPNTVSSLIADLQKLGIKEGMTLLVHSSLSSIGWVCGGAVSVIIALEKVLGESGTLLMPTHSGDLSDPAQWQNPPVPKSWWDVITAEMPAYNAAFTPTRGVGIIPETFRNQAGVIRSSHPQTSFVAWGKNKEYLVQDDHLDYQMNEKSPLGRLYELDGHILMLGSNYNHNTSLHLAEYKANYTSKNEIINSAPVIQNNERVWARFKDIDFNEDDFMLIGESFEKANAVKTGKIGLATSKLIRQRKIVDYAVSWMEENRN